VTAVAVSLGLAAWLATAAGEDVATPVLALGLAGTLLTALALVQAVLLGLALATSGAAYGLILAVDDPPLDVRAAGVAAGLLIVGELVGWSRELATTTRDEPGGAWRRPVWTASLGVGALLLVWALLALVDLARVEGLAVEAVGAVCALAALLVARRLALGSRDRQPSGG
jgi:hypothetical protein